MKKLLFVLPLVATLILTGCGSSGDGKEVGEQVKDPVKEIVEQVKNPVKEVVAEVKKEEIVEPTEKEVPDEKPSEEVKAGTHDDITTMFGTADFLSDKEISIDGYDIIIKHKDDIHAGEKLTWTISVTQGGNPINGFEKIEGDLGAGIVRDPVDHDEHVHPLANTKNTLTFSVHTHDAGDYKVITQFQHEGKKVTIPYTLNLLANTADHHD